MTFPGYVQGKPAVTLVDSGPSVNFVDCAFAVEHGFEVRQSSGSVLVAGGDAIPIQGFVNACVGIQSLNEELKLHVVDLPSRDIHAVLGQSWLRSAGLCCVLTRIVSGFGRGRGVAD